jgi:hemoglobin
MRKSFYRSLGLLVLMLLVGGVWGVQAQQAAHPTQETPSLYKRLGGYDALAAVTDDFIGRLVADKQLSRFFGGASTDSKKRIRQLVVDQLCQATGGPCFYIGRSMKASHAGLGITKAEWDLGVKLLTETLDKFKVPKAEQGELAKILSTLEPDIVEKK